MADSIPPAGPEAMARRITEGEPADGHPPRAEARREASGDFLLQFFTFAHLPVHLAEVSEPFCRLAQIIVNSLPANPERTVALRKLLESKDCAVRALVARR